MGKGGGGEDRVLREVGLGTLLDRLPEGEETCLTRLFRRDGVELSGGEGQKLAIARALWKDSPLLLLDEPTASLDPEAEREIYEKFLQMAAGKTAIFISHRLAVARAADKVAVLKEGKLVEYGSHRELLEKGGEYAGLFRMQSRGYSEKGRAIPPSPSPSLGAASSPSA